MSVMRLSSGSTDLTSGKLLLKVMSTLHKVLPGSQEHIAYMADMQLPAFRI